MTLPCGSGLLEAFRRNLLPPSSGYKGKPDEEKWSLISDIYLYTAVGFPPGGSGSETCAKEERDNYIQKEKQYTRQYQNNTKTKNTQNRKQNTKQKKSY